MIRICFMFLLLISTSACAKRTFVRSAPDYSNSLTHSKVALLLPPKIEVMQVDALNKKTRVHSHEDRLEGSLIDVLITKMQNKGYNIKFLSRAEIGDKKLSKHFLDTKDEFDDILNILYAGGGWSEEKAYSIDHKIPSVIDIGKKSGADLLVAITFYSEHKTSAAMARDFAMEVLKCVVTGRADLSSEKSEFSTVRIAVLDALSSKVLWTHSVSTSEDMVGTTISSLSKNEEVDKKNLSILFDSALSDLPDAK